MYILHHRKVMRLYIIIFLGSCTITALVLWIHWWCGNWSTVHHASWAAESWSKKQNYSWLAIHGIDAKGNAVELHDRVSSYMNMKEGSPSMKEQEGWPVHDVQEMLFSLRQMISHIMDSQMTTDVIKTIERHILLFFVLCPIWCIYETLRNLER